MIGPALLIALAAALIAGCTPYRIEYHRRPGFYQELSDDPLPERVVLPDGTIVVYSEDRDRDWTKDPGDTAEEFTLRTRRDDGSIALNCILPEHVIANTLQCIQREEYQLLWDELLAEETKLAYAEAGKDFFDFEDAMYEHRIDYARMLNRMSLGFNTSDVVVNRIGPNTYRLQFWPQAIRSRNGQSILKFTSMDIVQEGFQLKLKMIR